MKTIPGIFLFCLGVLVSAAGLDDAGFIREWMLLGPVKSDTDPGDARGDRLAARETLPVDGESSDLPGVTWRRLFSPTATVDLKGLCAPDSDNRTVFLAAEFETAAPFRGWIGVGSDDFEKVWLNGKPVLESNRKRGTVPDQDRVAVDFPAGRNRLLARIRNLDGGYDVCVRVVNHAALADKLRSTKQLRSADFSGKLAITDRMYDYFMTKPGAERRGNAAVPQGIIAFTTRRDRWRGFFGRMPARPDFLEIRSEMTLSHQPDFSFNPRELNRSIDAALAVGIDRIQISPVFASTLRQFADKAYGAGQIAEMTNFDGATLGKAFETTVFFSYCDPKAQQLMERIVCDTVGYYQTDPRGKYIVGWNFKAMTNSDWLYPAAKGFYDYSAPALAAYRAFLRERHGSIDRLNVAYGAAYADFSAVEMPPPPFDRIDLSRRWQEFQLFRRMQPTAAVERTRKLIRTLDPDRRIISWYTTAVWAASRDTVILDDAIEIARNNPNQLTSLTCFDYLNPAAEIWGQLALHNKVRVNVEPVFNTAKSYLQTFFNCLRFPVGQINWLYVIGSNDPRERPWLVWVLNRGALLDEAAAAELIQNPVAILAGYSDPFLTVGRELWSERMEPLRMLLRAAELANLQLGLFTDYSDRIDLSKFRAIVIPETRMLRPRAIERLAEFTAAGGTLLLLGEVAQYDLEQAAANWPLRRALGRNTAPAVGPEQWNFGKGRVIVPGKPTKELIRDNELTPRMRTLLADLGAEPVITATPSGVGAFLKRGKDGVHYAGLINLGDGPWQGRIAIPALPAGEYCAVDLVDGTAVNIRERGFDAKFDFADEIKFVKLFPAGAPMAPSRSEAELLTFREVASPRGRTVRFAGEESGDRWIAAGPAGARPAVTAVQPAEADQERFFRFDFPARKGEAGAAYAAFDRDHARLLPATTLRLRLRSDRAGDLDLVLPERDWAQSLTFRLRFEAKPGVWQEFAIDLERDFKLKENNLSIDRLRGELLVYSGRFRTEVPALSVELADVRLE